MRLHPERTADSGHLPGDNRKVFDFVGTINAGPCCAPARKSQEYPGFRQQKSRIDKTRLS
jgi:hypothetical protein